MSDYIVIDHFFWLIITLPTSISQLLLNVWVVPKTAIPKPVQQWSALGGTRMDWSNGRGATPPPTSAGTYIWSIHIYIYMQTKKSDSVHLRPPRLLPDICLTVASPEPHLLMHEAHLNHNRTISQVVSSDKKQHPTTYQLLLCIRSQRSRWSCLTSGQQCLLLSPCLHS